jgi:hypothetical protein
VLLVVDGEDEFIVGHPSDREKRWSAIDARRVLRHSTLPSSRSNPTSRVLSSPLRIPQLLGRHSHVPEGAAVGAYRLARDFDQSHVFVIESEFYCTESAGFDIV